MKISEMNNMEVKEPEGNKRIEDIPAATLWVIQPQAPHLLLAGFKENKGTEERSQGADRHVNFWIPIKRRRFGLKATMDLATKADDTQGVNCVFQHVMRMVILIGQCFGVMPVAGILEPNHSKLRFSLFSWRSLYALVLVAGQGLITSLCIFRFISDVATFDMAASVIFYGSNFTSLVVFMQLARLWPRLCQEVAKLEAPDPNSDTTLARKCTICALLTLFLAFLEHLLSLIAGFAVAMDCHSSKPVLEAYVVDAFPWIFSYFSYSHFLGVLSMALNFQSTFCWNFTNVFVISISFYLTSRLEQVNNRLNAVRGKYLPAAFWRGARESYSRATTLVRRLDAVASAIVFVCFANNLFFICLQLFHTLEDGIRGAPICTSLDRRLLGGHEHAIYFLYSFMFLLARSLAVSLVAARVHVAARAAAPPLYDVPSPVYCVEVQRFLDQINGDPVALTGLQFFNVTRGLVLTVAGTIVTYELVLMQFSAVSTDLTP